MVFVGTKGGQVYYFNDVTDPTPKLVIDMGVEVYNNVRIPSWIVTFQSGCPNEEGDVVVTHGTPARQLGRCNPIPELYANLLKLVRQGITFFHYTSRLPKHPASISYICCRRTTGSRASSI